jgi:hypothetical protein
MLGAVLVVVAACIVGKLLDKGSSSTRFNVFRKADEPLCCLYCLEGKSDRCFRIEPLDYINRIHVQFSEQQRFGIVCPRLRDPHNPELPKLLTGDARGLTNNTCVRIEDVDYLFGQEGAGLRYVKDRGKVMKEAPIPGKDRDRAWQTWWESENGRIRVIQSVEIIVGEQTRLYDTVLVKYHIWNRDKVPHKVGLRTMLHTHVAGNPQASFFIPPTEEKPARLVDGMEIINRKLIPEFLQVLETAELENPDTVIAPLVLKIRGCVPMDKLVLCRWPGDPNIGWDWPFEAINEPPDRPRDPCVVMYWPEVEMKPDEHWTLAFTYGLGRIGTCEESAVSCESGARMRLFAGPARLAKPFTVYCYIKPDPGQIVSLRLPPDLCLVDGQSAEQVVPPPDEKGYSVVSWQVLGHQTGDFIIEAKTPNLGIAQERVHIRLRSLFD